MLSIIIPVYNEEKNLKLLDSKIHRVLNKVGQEYEVIYIEDGSKDGSYKILTELAGENESIKVIRFTRNFGQTLAISAGVDYARGDILILMDADLQNEPEDIPRFLRKIEEGFDVVSGWRKDRKDALFTRRIPSYVANKLISAIAGLKLNDYGCTLKAYKREVIKGIKLYGQMHRFIPAYAAMKGYFVAEIEVSHYKRVYGKSKYGLLRTFKVILDLFTLRFIANYLTKPIYLFGGIGLCLFACGILLGIFVLARKIFFGGIWVSPSLFITITFLLMGVQFLLIGLLAEIIIRLYYMSQATTPYLIKEIIERKKLK